MSMVPAVAVYASTAPPIFISCLVVQTFAVGAALTNGVGEASAFGWASCGSAALARPWGAVSASAATDADRVTSIFNRRTGIVIGKV